MSEVWLRIAFEDAITHAVHASLAPSLIIDMAERGHPIENYEERYGRDRAVDLGRDNPKVITKWAFDCGGFWIQGEPEQRIEVTGLSIDVPCAQYEYVLPAVEKAKARQFADGEPYVNLKFWIHATVLTPSQHEALLDELRKHRAEAEARSLEFDRQREERRSAAP